MFLTRVAPDLISTNPAVPFHLKDMLFRPPPPFPAVFENVCPAPFSLFGKQKVELQARVKKEISPKRPQVRTRGLSTFKRVELKMFRETKCDLILFQTRRTSDFTPEKSDYWLSFLIIEVRRQNEGDERIRGFAIIALYKSTIDIDIDYWH